MEPSALDLLRLMLAKDPAKRISAAEALQHPFIQEAQHTESEMKRINFKTYLEEDMNKIGSCGEKLQTSFGSFQLRPKGIKVGQIDSIGSLNHSRENLRKEESNEKEREKESIFKRQHQTQKKSLFQRQHMDHAE